jgi:transposase
VVDVLGLLLVVMVHSAGIQDRDGAKQVLTALVARFPGLQLIWADGGYAGKLVAWVTTVLQRTLVIVKRPQHTQGFHVVQWRWIVERTFGWLNRWSCIAPLRIIQSAQKSTTMPSVHHHLRGHCHGTDSLFLPPRACGFGVRFPPALRAVAQ